MEPEKQIINPSPVDGVTPESEPQVPKPVEPTLLTSIPVVPRTPKSKKKIFVIAGIVILVIVILGIGGYFGYTKFIAKPSPTPTPAPQPTVEPTPTATSDPSADWETYTNNKFKLTFMYPKTLAFEEYLVSDNQLQAIFNKNQPINFIIGADLDYKPENVTYLLDQKPNGTKTINNNTWNTYYSSSGYGDAGGYSAPYFGLQIEMNHVLYSAIFYNQDTIDPIQEQILSTFKFID